MSAPLYRRPPNVAVVEEDPPGDGTVPSIYLAQLPNGPMSELDGSAALIWREAVTSGTPDLVTRVAEIVGVPPDEIRDDVEAFLEDLLRRGLLECTEDLADT